MTTARALFHRCRKAGIALSVEGEKIIYEAPKGTPIPLDDLRQCKPELLAVLRGDYIRAGAYLILRYADKLDQQDALAERFEEQAKASGLAIGEAERRAYIGLARHIERMVKP